MGLLIEANERRRLNSKENLGFDVLSWKEAKEVVIFAAGEGINEMSYNEKMGHVMGIVLVDFRKEMEMNCDGFWSSKQ
ncbi:hypothetical protein C5167_016405 [Papaver somniferum]|nr:hypothetical protein C5167_016405 [Papaver somniferum]